ncbi:MAG TPA: methyltransferase domain-containing protein [Candidatus Acidoferrales bacterium]|nr:methyltransferase domain-containing protein [Candidatus Acidoferrales bacterium]
MTSNPCIQASLGIAEALRRPDPISRCGNSESGACAEDGSRSAMTNEDQKDSATVWFGSLYCLFKASRGISWGKDEYIPVDVMDYRKQQEFLRNSRVCGVSLVLVLLGMAAICLRTGGEITLAVLIAFAMATVALAASIYYTPNYLHLTVVPQKTLRWEIRIRWRVIGAALIIGMLLASSTRGRISVLIAAAWLLVANLLARRVVPQGYFPAYFWATDYALLATALLFTPFNLLLGAVLLAAAAHLSIVICSKRHLLWAALVTICGWLLVFFSAQRRGAGLEAGLSCAGLLVITTLATAWLVDRAERHNAKNISAAMRELMDFNGFSADRIRHLWQVSNQELAENWQEAAIAEDDAERMAEWYRRNSELYLFAISGYNLEYKRIRSNLQVIRFARGFCLDYGAGNGELLLELARRGHPVTYYDVEGESMKFAQGRAKKQGLAVEIAHSKEDLAAAARTHGFDTIFSFDVLEHLPDLPGELNFLSSLLNPGGLLVFDVPAGSTKSHPMHLNHHLDILAHLSAKGLEDKRNLALKLPLKREEKFVFQAPRH